VRAARRARQQDLTVKAHTPEMAALLAGTEPLVYADLYTLQFADSTVLRMTTFDRLLGLTFGPNTFVPVGPIIDRASIKQSVGVEVRTMDLTITPGPADLINGVPWLQAARLGAFDGCYVLLERAVMPASAPEDTSAGKFWKFSGYCADVGGDRMSMQTTVRSLEERYNRLFPINIFQPGCRRTLFDPRCGLDKGDFAQATTIGSGSTETVITCDLAAADGYYSLGTIEFQDGDNAGAWRSIKSYTAGVARLARPLLSAPIVGQSAIAYPGCDKRFDTCDVKFGNKDRFSGEDSIPVPETAV
jgi:uncharacterized phage protein (TIGR02218 family)